MVVDITGMAFGGEGIARQNNFVTFVKGAVPGQRVTLKNLVVKKNHAKAEVGEVLQEFAGKEPPPCASFGECGGCQWQGVPYEQQVNWKQKFITDALTRLGGQKELPQLTFFPAPNSWEYRERIRVQLIVVPGGHKTLGFFRSGTHQVMAIPRCEIAAPPLNRLLCRLNQLQFDPKEDYHCAMEWQVCQSGQEATAATILLSDPVSEASLQSLVKQLKGFGVSHVRVMSQPAASYYCYDHQFGVDYYTAPGVFQQVNHGANRQVRQTVREVLQRFDFAALLDLYCGSGNLSLGLGSDVVNVVGVEASAAAIACANHSVAANQLSGHRYRAGDAGELLREELRQKRFQVVLADPPRAGMSDCVPALLHSGVDHILYLSCDPATMARDVKRLCGGAYTLKQVWGFDFFPQTYHVETLVWLQRQ